MTKERIMFFWVIVFLLLDELTGFLFPADFQYESISVVTHFGFLCTMMFLYSQPLLTSILFSSFVGFITDFFFTESFPLYGVLYGLLAAGIYLSADILKRYSWNKLVIAFVALVLLDWIPFFFFSIFGNLNVSFWTWFIHFQLISLLINGAMLFFMQYLVDVMDRYYTIRKHRIRRQEMKILRKLRLPK